MPEPRLTEEQIAAAEKFLMTSVPDRTNAYRALRQVRGDLDAERDDRKEHSCACYVDPTDDAAYRPCDFHEQMQAERDVAREQAAMLQTMLRAEHSPHAEWIGCRTCASLANLPAAVQRHLERDKVAEDIAEELWNFRVALQGQGLTNLLQKLAAYRAAGGEESK